MAIIKNEAVVDLTQYSSAALSKITSMTNVALVLLPADAPEEYYEAYAQIKKANIASIIQIPSGKIVTQATERRLSQRRSFPKTLLSSQTVSAFSRDLTATQANAAFMSAES